MNAPETGLARVARRGAGALSVMLLTSCTASLELDRFRLEEAPAQSVAPINVNYFDVKITMKEMQSHLNEYLEIRLVDRNNAVQAKAIYNEVVGPDFILFLGRLVPKQNAPYRLDFWADHNFTARYDGIVGGINDKDHAWRRVLADPLPEDIRLVGSRYELEFLHNTTFDDIFTDLAGNKISGEDELLNCDIVVTTPPQYLDKMFEVRVTERESGRMSGLYRQGRAKPTFHALIPGVLDEVTNYDVSAYVDINDSGGYDAVDPSWKIQITSGANAGGGDLNLETTPQSPIETGELTP